uniref:Uncharacterized protein n=1 Tax=Lepeophtheirus salmonis TaxID=72036 RepID=A0A0K2V8V6_LEPSM
MMVEPCCNELLPLTDSNSLLDLGLTLIKNCSIF